MNWDDLIGGGDRWQHRQTDTYLILIFRNTQLNVLSSAEFATEP